MDFVTNKKARFDYEILDTFEAGIELFGHEVKSVRDKNVSLDGSRVTVRGGEAYLLNANISPYQPKNIADTYESERKRKLLLSKKELIELSKAEDTKGLTLIPLSLYNKGKLIKVKIAIVKGKKKFDKRESIKKRDTERDVRREIKNR